MRTTTKVRKEERGLLKVVFLGPVETPTSREEFLRGGN